MKTNFSLTKSGKRLVAFLLLLSLLAGSMFMLAACKKTTDQVEETTQKAEELKTKVEDSTKQGTTQQETITTQETTTVKLTDPVVDLNPPALTDQDKVVSVNGYGANGALADEELSLADMFQYAIEDEYLAHAEYKAIVDKFGANTKPYVNIIPSEETHISYMKELYKAYKIEVPTDKSAEHVVVPDNLLSAAEKGRDAEINNIAMYELFLGYELPENVREVFTMLKSASERHLTSFENQVTQLSE